MKSLMLALVIVIMNVMSVVAQANAGTHVPEDFVVCTGWHALCSASPDCKMNGEKVSCDCARVNETHIVATNEIQDLIVKRLTLARCTTIHPCAVDEAPVCKAIKSGRYEVGFSKEHLPISHAWL